MSTNGPQPTQGAPKKEKKREAGRLFFGVVFLSLVFFFFFFGPPLLCHAVIEDRGPKHDHNATVLCALEGLLFARGRCLCSGHYAAASPPQIPSATTQLWIGLEALAPRTPSRGESHFHHLAFAVEETTCHHSNS